MNTYTRQYQHKPSKNRAVPLTFRPIIKPSKPSRPSARARLGGLHARFGLLGGPFWPLGLLGLGLITALSVSPLSCTARMAMSVVLLCSAVLNTQFALFCGEDSKSMSITGQSRFTEHRLLSKPCDWECPWRSGASANPTSSQSTQSTLTLEGSPRS